MAKGRKISSLFSLFDHLCSVVMVACILCASVISCAAEQAAQDGAGVSTLASRPVMLKKNRSKPTPDQLSSPFIPEIRLSGQLPFFYTSNASALPNFADRDGYIGPSTRLTATFFPKDDFNIQFFGETYSELYRREYFSGFTRFSGGVWLKYRWGNFDFASGFAERRTHDQEKFEFTVETHDANFKSSYYAKLADDVTFIPTFYATRRFASFRTSTRWRFRLELPLTKYVGDWSFTLVPWFNFDYFDRNRPLRRDVSINMDAEVRYRLSDDTWVSFLATATKNYSNYAGNRFRRLDVGPILGFTTKF